MTLSGIPARQAQRTRLSLQQSASVRLSYAIKAPTLIHDILVDGVVRGTSENAKTKKAAKEEAGRNAYIAMGWLNYN